MKIFNTSDLKESKRILASLPSTNKLSLEALLLNNKNRGNKKKLDPSILDLFWWILVFNHYRWISEFEALSHPYLSVYHDPEEDEPVYPLINIDEGEFWKNG